MFFAFLIRIFVLYVIVTLWFAQKMSTFCVRLFTFQWVYFFELEQIRGISKAPAYKKECHILQACTFQFAKSRIAIIALPCFKRACFDFFLQKWQIFVTLLDKSKNMFFILYRERTFCVVSIVFTTLLKPTKKWSSPNAVFYHSLSKKEIFYVFCLDDIEKKSLFQKVCFLPLKTKLSTIILAIIDSISFVEIAFGIPSGWPKNAIVNFS